jgi:hypothetical protein
MKLTKYHLDYTAFIAVVILLAAAFIWIVVSIMTDPLAL